MVLELMPIYDDEMFTQESLLAETTTRTDPNGPLQMDN